MLAQSQVRQPNDTAFAICHDCNSLHKARRTNLTSAGPKRRPKDMQQACIASCMGVSLWKSLELVKAAADATGCC